MGSQVTTLGSVFGFAAHPQGTLDKELPFPEFQFLPDYKEGTGWRNPFLLWFLGL